MTLLQNRIRRRSFRMAGSAKKLRKTLSTHKLHPAHPKFCLDDSMDVDHHPQLGKELLHSFNLIIEELRAECKSFEQTISRLDNIHAELEKLKCKVMQLDEQGIKENLSDLIKQKENILDLYEQNNP